MMRRACAGLSRLSSQLGRGLKSGIGSIFIGLIRGYQWGISPMMAPRCRYLPTCSAYGVDAIRLHGPYLGGCLALRRICRCHPWSQGGWDPVPERASCLRFFR